MKAFISKKHTIRFVFISFLFILGYLVGAGLAKAFGQKPAYSQTSIFYEISGHGLKEPSYLLGTYHLINSGFINQYPPVTQAFMQAKGAVVEVILDSAELVRVQTKGLLQNEKLSNLLDKPFADSLNTTLLNTIGAPLSALDQLKPANVMLVTALVQNMKDNDSLLKAFSGLPMDKSIAESAKKSGKQLTALETLDQQMDLLFNHESLDEQVQQLKTFVRRYDEGRQLGNALVKAYIAHDLAAMEKIGDQSMAITGQADYMLKDRNNNWMKVLPTLMHAKSQFIAVGALHLCGEWGLVNQLRQQGFEVKAIALK